MKTISILLDIGYHRPTSYKTSAEKQKKIGAATYEAVRLFFLSKKTNDCHHQFNGQ